MDAGQAPNISVDAPRRLVLILGAPRSGTTWLAKIFDSHPRVLYRHEPDTIIRSEILPTICKAKEVERYRGVAASYLRELIRANTLKTAGSRPTFDKDYLTPAQNLKRRAAISAWRMLDLITRGAIPEYLQMPELIPPNQLRDAVIVIKSVSARGRAGVLAAAAPSSHFLFLIRHPFGQVASMLRGLATGKFESKIGFDEVLDAEWGRKLGLTRSAMERFPLVEQLAWHWAILNQKVLDDLGNHAHFRRIQYERLCDRPGAMAKELFGYVGLAWNAATASFIAGSTTYRGRRRYYDVKANTAEMAEGWRSALDRPDRLRVLNVIRNFPIGEAYEDESGDFDSGLTSLACSAS